MSTELTEAEMAAAAIVGKAMLAAMRRTKLPARAQINAAIHALAVVGPMVLEERR